MVTEKEYLDKVSAVLKDSYKTLPETLVALTGLFEMAADLEEPSSTQTEDLSPSTSRCPEIES